MDESFTKFNRLIADEILTFIENSDEDLLYIGGFQGCGKSELMENVLTEANLEDTLLFRHLCFENSAIDDFLLGFYDTFRYYSINKKIVLKKSLTENFAQKVSFYFKDIDKNNLIVIDNFDIISKNSEIIDFLAHLGKYENVKLILITREINPEYFENKGLKCHTIEIAPNNYETFKMKIQDAVKIFDEADVAELFNQTKGYELYLKMTLRYLNTVNISLKEFMEEFEKRSLQFDNFLLTKIVSLVPPIYLPFLQNMAAISHSVKIDFIENYGLGDISQVNYLNRKLLISMFSDEIYLKDYLKHYFLDNLSVQAKNNIYKTLIQIYENELTKSPKDRLLRLSRESIRKQINSVKEKLPAIARPRGFVAPNYGYLPQTGTNPKAPWMSKLTTLKAKKGLHNLDFGPKNGVQKTQKPSIDELVGKGALSEEEKTLLENFRANKEKQVKAALDGTDILLKQAKDLEEKYDYQGAIRCLTEALDKTKQENSGKIFMQLARNSIKINAFEEAVNYFSKACENFTQFKKDDSCITAKLETAALYRKLYKLEKAKNTLNEIINYKGDVSKNSVAKGYLGLGEIFEMENNFKKALENYQTALEKSDAENPDSKLLSEIYFKTAALYDDGQNVQKALEYYQKSIENGEKAQYSKEDSNYISDSYANLGLIYSENGDYDKATANFEAALKIDTEKNNINGIYFANRQLSMIYKDFEPEKSLEYLVCALESAQKLDDSFKIALSHIELGDYYYNTRENRIALENYLQAKKTLGTSVSEENEQRISIRINDMKVKMDKDEFEEILKEYEF